MSSSSFFTLFGQSCEAASARRKVAIIKIIAYNELIIYRLIFEQIVIVLNLKEKIAKCHSSEGDAN